MTCQKPKARWRNGNGYDKNVYFTSAIKKYGWNSFSHEILLDGLSLTEASEKEIKLIAELRTNDREFGYNISTGGEISIPTEESKQKIRECNLGKKNSKETRQKISAALKGRVALPSQILHLILKNKRSEQTIITTNIETLETIEFLSKKECLKTLGSQFRYTTKEKIHICNGFIAQKKEEYFEVTSEVLEKLMTERIERIKKSQFAM